MASTQARDCNVRPSASRLLASPRVLYPSAFRLGPAATTGDTALVPVTFTWKGGGTQPGVTVVLTRRGRWRIADIRFMRGGTLRDLLAGKE